MHLTEIMLEDLLYIYTAATYHQRAVWPSNGNQQRTRLALLRHGLIEQADDPRQTATITKTGLDVLVQRRWLSVERMLANSKPRPAQLPPRPQQRPQPEPEEQPAPRSWFDREDMLLPREPERRLHVHQIDPLA